MEEPRPEKVAVVAEVRERLSGADAALLTEYRGIDVAQMSELRRALRAAGGEYKIYKNTLVRFAARELGLDIEDLLVGPTAIAFVPADGSGDAVTVAKALSEFAKGNDHLVVKGGILGDKLLTAEEAKALADVAPREELLARLAGLLQAPLQQFAGLLQAPLRDFAGLTQALIDAGGAGATDTGATDTGATDTDPSPAADAAPDPDAAEPAAPPQDAADAADTPTEDN